MSVPLPISGEVDVTVGIADKVMDATIEVVKQTQSTNESPVSEITKQTQSTGEGVGVATNNRSDPDAA